MALSNGPNLGLLVNGADGEEHYLDLMKAWRGLDGLVMPHVQSRTLATPPTNIVDGQTYIIPANATGAWAGRTNRIARGFTVGTNAPGWEYYVPKKGWSVMVEDEGDINGVPLEYRYDGTNWAKPDLGPTREEVLLNPMTTVGDIIIAGDDGSPIRLPAGGNKQVLTSEDGVPKWLDPEVSGGGGGGGMTNPMAAEGDLVVGGASGVAQRLGVGTAGQVLKVVDGIPQWGNESGGGGGGMDNPMTTAGDIIVADAGGVPMRLGKGGDGQVLKMVAGLLAWANEAVGLTNPMTTPSDLIVGGIDGAPTRLPKGADNQVLKIISGALQWAEDAGGMTNPMSALGDLIIGGTSGAPARLAPGSAGQVLKMVSGQPAWAAESGGGGGGPASTDELVEGVTNLYFTAARVRAVVMTGLSITTSTIVLATDTLIVAIGKLQAQVNARLPLAGGQMTGAVLQAPPVNVASAATTNIAVSTAETINITGTTTITAFSTAPAGVRKRLVFGGVLTLTHGPSSLILPGYANITTTAGDVAEMESLGGGNWKCVSYTKVNGRQVALGAVVPTLTAANETNIYAPGVDVVKVSGTTGVGYLGSGADGQEVTVIFTGATPLYGSASLILPGGGNMTTAAGDVARFVYEGAGVTRCETYQRASAADRRSDLGLGTFATADFASAPFVNLMPDSGRFAGKIDPLSLQITAAFSASGFLAAYNGGSHSSGGKFIYNNTTNGGNGGALTEPVISLLAALGRSGTSARYGVEFYVDTYTVGTGTLSPNVGADSVTRYYSTVNGSRALFMASSYCTFTGWVRCRSGSMHISYPYYKNGVLVPGGTTILPAEGWVHVRVHASSDIGYSNSLPGLCCATSSVWDLALPAFFGGIVDTGLHKAPLATINELSS